MRLYIVSCKEKRLFVHSLFFYEGVHEVLQPIKIFVLRDFIVALTTISLVFPRPYRKRWDLPFYNSRFIVVLRLRDTLPFRSALCCVLYYIYGAEIRIKFIFADVFANGSY